MSGLVFRPIDRVGQALVEARREAARARAAAWYAANRERAQATQAAYRAAHREERRATDAAYLAANRERKQERDRAYRAANRDRIAAWRARYQKANHDRLAERARLRYLANPAAARRRGQEWLRARPTLAAAGFAANAANRRADMWDADGRLSREDVLALWIREPVCVDCGDGRGLDHVIPLSRGGSNTTGNLANRCRFCNSRKGVRERRAAA